MQKYIHFKAWAFNEIFRFVEQKVLLTIYSPWSPDDKKKIKKETAETICKLSIILFKLSKQSTNLKTTISNCGVGIRSSISTLPRFSPSRGSTFILPTCSTWSPSQRPKLSARPPDFTLSKAEHIESHRCPWVACWGNPWPKKHAYCYQDAWSDITLEIQILRYTSVSIVPFVESPYKW